MRIYAFATAMALFAVNGLAQETYEIANLGTQDLNGTARYVGMGGAMEALGADISTMSTNPAGIGLFRKSQFTGTLSLVTQDEESSFASANKTNLSFDQLGLVYVNQVSDNSFINLGFTYRKSRNFNQILSVADRLDGASQSKLTLDKFADGYIQTSDDWTYSQVDAMYHDGLYLDDNGNSLLIDRNGNFTDNGYAFSGDGYQYGRGNYGYIGEYDFNISGNINDRTFLGFTVGIHDVHYHGYSLYDETWQPNPLSLNHATLEDHRDITGTGIDFKLGAIFRPIEESPFRVGVYLNSPIFYNLESSNNSGLRLNDDYYSGSPRFDVYDYEFRTPWKFGLSLGHTVDNYLAFGATYEYADYSSTDARIKDDSDWYYDDYNSSSDDNMNAHIRQTLKGTSTLKLGAEYRPDEDIAIRLGYNYVSPMYKKDSSRGVDVWSPGNFMSSSTEYINWKDTQRITVGIGFNLSSKVKLDAAYQYSTQRGQFLPFAGSHDDNLPFDKTVNFKRNQWMTTCVYTL